MEASLIGQPGTRVQLRVVEEVKAEPERVQTQHHNMAAPIVPVILPRARIVTQTSVQVSLKNICWWRKKRKKYIKQNELYHCKEK
jgi:hypothetical protein